MRVSALRIIRGTRVFYCQLLCGIYWVTSRERKWEPLSANSACGGGKKKKLLPQEGNDVQGGEEDSEDGLSHIFQDQRVGPKILRPSGLFRSPGPGSP